MDNPQPSDQPRDEVDVREDAALPEPPEPPVPPPVTPKLKGESPLSRMSAFFSRANNRLLPWLRERSGKEIFVVSLRVLNTCLLIAVVYFLYAHLLPYCHNDREDESPDVATLIQPLVEQLDKLGELAVTLDRQNENLLLAIGDLSKPPATHGDRQDVDMLAKQIDRLTGQLKSMESTVVGLMKTANADSPRYEEFFTKLLATATQLDKRFDEVQRSLVKMNDSSDSPLKADIARFESRVSEVSSSITSCRAGIDQLSRMLTDKVDTLVTQRIFPPQDVLLVAMHTPRLSAASHWSTYRSIFSRPLPGETDDAGPRVTFAVGSTGELSILREPGTTLPVAPPIVITKATENPRALAAAIKGDYVDMIPAEELKDRRQRCVLVASESCVSLSDADLARFEDFAQVDVVLIKNDPSGRGDSIIEWDLWITQHPRWNVHLVQLEDQEGFSRLLTGLLQPVPFPAEKK